MPKNLLKYNILILINVRWWNATAFYAINIARLLHKNNHKVIIGCKKKYPPYRMAQSYGLRVEPLNFFGYNVFLLCRNFFKMLNLIKKENIQIINSHRSEDHTFALLAKWFTAVKLVITRGDRRKISNNYFSRLRYESSDSTILTCQSLYRQNRHILEPLKHKISTIYGSLDEDHFKVTKSKKQIEKQYNIPSNKLIIGLAGRTDYVKDQYTFLKAASLASSKLPNALFIITGREEHIKYRQLQMIIDELNLNKQFKLLPHIDNMPDMIKLFDIGIITSIDSETICRILLEYMYLKKPVIGTDINAIGEIIKPGYNGELFKPKDHKALAQYIIKIAKNKSLQKRYSQNAFTLYKKMYSENLFLKQYLKIFNQLLFKKS